MKKARQTAINSHVIALQLATTEGRGGGESLRAAECGTGMIMLYGDDVSATASQAQIKNSL